MQSLSVAQQIDNIMSAVKESRCCSLTDQGIIDCGIPCRGRCCIDGPSYCSEPCSLSSEWNLKLKELYLQMYEALPDDNQETVLNLFTPIEKFEKLVLNRAIKVIPAFSSCKHERKATFGKKRCVLCNSDSNDFGTNYHPENSIGNGPNFKSRYAVTSNLNSFSCMDCEYKICAYCALVYDTIVLGKIQPLHEHDLPLVDDAGYDSYMCDVCRKGNHGTRYHCRTCKFDLCLPCHDNYERLRSQTH